MLVKLYGLTWVLGILAVGLFYITGNFTPIVSVVFGLLSEVAILMGMTNVLPTAIGDSSRPKGSKSVSRLLPRTAGESRSIRSLPPRSELSTLVREHRRLADAGHRAV